MITDIGAISKEPTKYKTSSSVEYSGNSEIQTDLLTGLVKYSKTTSKSLTQSNPNQINSDEINEYPPGKYTKTTTTIVFRPHGRDIIEIPAFVI